MAKAPYYAGDNVPLKFKVLEANDPVTPSAAKVTIVKPDGTKFDQTDATINENEISYTVPTTDTAKGGKYEAYFDLTLPDGLERTHKMEFEVEYNLE